MLPPSDWVGDVAPGGGANPPCLTQTGGSGFLLSGQPLPHVRVSTCRRANPVPRAVASGPPPSGERRVQQVIKHPKASGFEWSGPCDQCVIVLLGLVGAVGSEGSGSELSQPVPSQSTQGCANEVPSNRTPVPLHRGQSVSSCSVHVATRSASPPGSTRPQPRPPQLTQGSSQGVPSYHFPVPQHMRHRPAMPVPVCSTGRSLSATDSPILLTHLNSFESQPSCFIGASSQSRRIHDDDPAPRA
jgi:hypothetical protein